MLCVTDFGRRVVGAGAAASNMGTRTDSGECCHKSGDRPSLVNSLMSSCQYGHCRSTVIAPFYSYRSLLQLSLPSDGLILVQIPEIED